MLVNTLLADLEPHHFHVGKDQKGPTAPGPLGSTSSAGFSRWELARASEELWKYDRRLPRNRFFHRAPSIDT